MGKENREKTLQIEGMTCAGCSQAVERALSRVSGVETATVNLLTGEARVRHTDPVSTEAVLSRRRRCGWLQSSTSYKALPTTHQAGN